MYQKSAMLSLRLTTPSNGSTGISCRLTWILECEYNSIDSCNKRGRYRLYANINVLGFVLALDD